MFDNEFYGEEHFIRELDGTTITEGVKEQPPGDLIAFFYEKLSSAVDHYRIDQIVNVVRELDTGFTKCPHADIVLNSLRDALTGRLVAHENYYQVNDPTARELSILEKKLHLLPRHALGENYFSRSTAPELNILLEQQSVLEQSLNPLEPELFFKYWPVPITLKKQLDIEIQSQVRNIYADITLDKELLKPGIQEFLMTAMAFKYIQETKNNTLIEELKKAGIEVPLKIVLIGGSMSRLDMLESLCHQAGIQIGRFEGMTIDPKFASYSEQQQKELERKTAKENSIWIQGMINQGAVFIDIGGSPDKYASQLVELQTALQLGETQPFFGTCYYALEALTIVVNYYLGARFGYVPLYQGKGSAMPMEGSGMIDHPEDASLMREINKARGKKTLNFL